MQIVGGLPRPAKRPFVFLAPVIRAHDEDAHWLSVGELVLHVLEQVVVPAEDHLLFVEGRLWAEIHVPDFAAIARVSSDRDHEVLSLTRTWSRGMRFESKI